MLPQHETRTPVSKNGCVANIPAGMSPVPWGSFFPVCERSLAGPVLGRSSAGSFCDFFLRLHWQYHNQKTAFPQPSFIPFPQCPLSDFNGNHSLSDAHYLFLPGTQRSVETQAKDLLEAAHAYTRSSLMTGTIYMQTLSSFALEWLTSSCEYPPCLCVLLGAPWQVTLVEVCCRNSLQTDWS